MGNLPQASHNNLGEFWPIPPDRAGVTESVCRPPCLHMFFSSAHKFLIGWRSGLCDGHSNTLTLLSLIHFATTLEICLGSLSIWKTHLRSSFNFLTDYLRCCYNISTQFSILMMPSILSSAPVFSGGLEQCLLPCWAAFQVMSIKDTFYFGYRYFCKVLFHKVLCCCSGIDLHFSHQSTFISRRQCASPSWAVLWLRGPMVFILAYYCLYRWTWYLQQGWARLVEVYNLFSEGLSDFFWFSHDVKQRGTEFERRPWNTSTGTPPIDSNDVN